MLREQLFELRCAAAEALRYLGDVARPRLLAGARDLPVHLLERALALLCDVPQRCPLSVELPAVVEDTQHVLLVVLLRPVLSVAQLLLDSVEVHWGVDDVEVARDVAGVDCPEHAEERALEKILDDLRALLLQHRIHQKMWHFSNIWDD